MDRTWLDDRGVLLTSCCPLPMDGPFLGAAVHGLGVSRRDFVAMRQRGLVRQVLRGVYAARQVPDDMVLRARALALVVPQTAVVCDRTAAWLHGVDILPRTALETPPPVSVVHVDDTRVRRPCVDGRRRQLLPGDVTVVRGVRVTTALRTSLDLGRTLWRLDALAAIDGFLRIGVPHELMCADAARFRGARGVRQLRALLPLGDGRAESPGESALRLLWYDAGLPRPELQLEVRNDQGFVVFVLDIADETSGYSAEYDGAAFHTDTAHDERRREWVERHRGITVKAFTKADVYAPRGDAVGRLRREFDEARLRTSRWSPGRCG